MCTVYTPVHDLSNLFGGEGQDRTDDLRVMNPALSPAELHHLGVSNENRTHDSGITTRGFATKLWTPYRNTLLISG